MRTLSNIGVLSNIGFDLGEVETVPEKQIDQKTPLMIALALNCAGAAKKSSKDHVRTPHVERPWFQESSELTCCTTSAVQTGKRR